VRRYTLDPDQKDRAGFEPAAPQARVCQRPVNRSAIGKLPSVFPPRRRSSQLRQLPPDRFFPIQSLGPLSSIWWLAFHFAFPYIFASRIAFCFFMVYPAPRYQRHKPNLCGLLSVLPIPVRLSYQNGSGRVGYLLCRISRPARNR
jgi:hypothetical protein